MKVKTFSNRDGNKLNEEVNKWIKESGVKVHNASTTFGEITVEGVQEPGSKRISRKVGGFIMTVIYDD
jgi:hypothetical protein